MGNRTFTVFGRGDVSVTPDVTLIKIQLKGLRDTYNDAYELAGANNKVLQEAAKHFT